VFAARFLFLGFAFAPASATWCFDPQNIARFGVEGALPG
jgi:hypothetical protein